MHVQPFYCCRAFITVSNSWVLGPFTSTPASSSHFQQQTHGCLLPHTCRHICTLVSEDPEEAMATHSSTLAWKIPWTEEPGRLQSMGSWRVGSWTRLSDFTFAFHFHALGKEMATHSSVLAWRIPGTGEPGGLLSVGSHRVWLKRLSSSSQITRATSRTPGLSSLIF